MEGLQSQKPQEIIEWSDKTFLCTTDSDFFPRWKDATCLCTHCARESDSSVVLSCWQLAVTKFLLMESQQPNLSFQKILIINTAAVAACTCSTVYVCVHASVFINAYGFLIVY